VSPPDTCRFCRLYAQSAPCFAALIGGWTSLQFMLEPRLGLHTPLLSSLLRASSPAASGTALLLALVLWAQPLSPSALRGELPRVLERAVLVTVPGYLASALLATAAAWAVARAFGFGFTLAGLRLSWLAFGAGAALLDTALAVFLAWRFLARLRAGRMSLPAQLILVLTVTVPLRATVALIFANLLSG
jgi:hypothetical protein